MMAVARARQRSTYETTQLRRTDDTSTAAPEPSCWAVTLLAQLLPEPSICGTWGEELYIQALELL